MIRTTETTPCRRPLPRPWASITLLAIAATLPVAGCDTGGRDARRAETVSAAAQADSGPVNLALHMPASQSSTAAGGDAWRAVDGDTDGAFADQSVSLTNSDAQAFWQVDLGSPQAIGDVVVWSRTDATPAGAWLSDFQVMVSGDGTTWRAYPYEAAAPITSPASVTFAVNDTARYVKVALVGPGPLSLAEVQVLAAPSPSAVGAGLYVASNDALWQRGLIGPATGNDWANAGQAYHVVGMTSWNGGLYVVADDELWRRGALGATSGNDWTGVVPAYAVVGMATYGQDLYVASNGSYWRLGAGNQWIDAGPASGVGAMATFGGTFYAVTGNQLVSYASGPGSATTVVGDAAGITAMTAYQGSLYAADGGTLYRAEGALAPGSGWRWAPVGQAYGVTGMAAFAACTPGLELTTGGACVNPYASVGKVQVADFAQPPASRRSYVEGWAESPRLAGYLDPGDLHLVGDFMGKGHAQVMHVNRDSYLGYGKIAIVDYAGSASHGGGDLLYSEKWASPDMLGGWLDPDDLQLVGDFTGAGHSQVMFVNRDGAGGKVMIVDYASGAPAVRYREDWGQSHLLDGWLDIVPALPPWLPDMSDRQIAGDFMGLHHSQVMFVNRGGSDGKVMIVDYATGTPSARYFESYGQSPQLDGWLDDGDLQLVGDFTGVGHAQSMYINRGGSDGKVMIVDYAGQTVPGQVDYVEAWGQSTVLGGWLDDGDLQIAGDFTGAGHAQLLAVNRQNRGDGKIEVVDYASGIIGGAIPYLESWTTPTVMDAFIGAGDVSVAGDFTGVGHDQLESWNLDDPAAGNAQACPAGQLQLPDTHTCVTVTPWAVPGVPRQQELPDGQIIALRASAYLPFGATLDSPFTAFGPTWVQLTSSGSVAYLDAGAGSLSSNTMFTASYYPVVPGDQLMDATPMTRYEKLRITGPNGQWVLSPTGPLTDWTTLAANGATAAGGGMNLLLDLQATRDGDPLTPTGQIFSSGPADPTRPAQYSRWSLHFLAGTGAESGFVFYGNEIDSGAPDELSLTPDDAVDIFVVQQRY